MGGHECLSAHTKVPHRTMRDGLGDLLKRIAYLILLPSCKSSRMFTDRLILFVHHLVLKE